MKCDLPLPGTLFCRDRASAFPGLDLEWHSSLFHGRSLWYAYDCSGTGSL